TDGENILPVLEGKVQASERTLYSRYKAETHRAVRAGQSKYLLIGGHEFLFYLEYDVRERANMRDRLLEVFERLKKQWEEWNDTMLTITEEVYSHGIVSEEQVDRYAPEPAMPMK